MKKAIIIFFIASTLFIVFSFLCFFIDNFGVIKDGGDVRYGASFPFKIHWWSFMGQHGEGTQINYFNILWNILFYIFWIIVFYKFIIKRELLKVKKKLF